MIEELQKEVASGQTTFEFIISGYLKTIENREPEINAFITVCAENSLTRARELDAFIGLGKPVGPLAGVPIAVKDNICTMGTRTTCASRMLATFIPPYNATVVEKLQEADAIIIGKTNLDEFAMGSSCETGYFGPTQNPPDSRCIPGGSSGGSAASVGAKEAVGALGSDTGGSIRQPASHCGVVGLKPTYGRVSRYGLIAFASSLDQIGPFATSVEDCAKVLRVIAGHDPHDSTSVNLPVPDYSQDLKREIRGLRVGIPKEYFGKGLMPEVEGPVKKTLQNLADEGAELIDISLPHLEYAIATYYIICTAEASSNLARYDGVKYGYRTAGAKDLRDMYSMTRKEGFGSEVKRRIMLGTYVLSSGYYDAYYSKAAKARTLIAGDYHEAWKRCDVIAAPVAPGPAFKIGEMTNDPLQMYLSDIYTISLNLAGLPGITVPCGWAGKLPVGIQFIGRAFDETTILRTAWHAERLCN